MDGVPVTSGQQHSDRRDSWRHSDAVGDVVLSRNPGHPARLDPVGTAINNFVTAYNQVMTDINTQNTYSGSGTAPPLLGDPSLDLLQSQLLNGITTSMSGNGGLVNLQSIGIQLQEDGTLSVASSTSADSMDLNDALTNDFSAVQNLFQSASLHPRAWPRLSIPRSLRSPTLPTAP